jgi:hypothetical protein
MCNCHSYNLDIGSVPPVAVKTNLHSSGYIHIDACIAPVIQHLVNNGIRTEASCCGHNRESPSIILSDGANKKYVEEVRKIIAEVDDRKFDLLSWSLYDYTNDRLYYEDKISKEMSIG